MHKFGGAWTEIKLNVLREYLNAYTKAMSKQKWATLTYVDAFAGSGERTEDKGPMPILGITAEEYSHDGSAKIAIDTSPQFDRLLFIEKNRERVIALEELQKQHQNRDIQIEQGDANDKLKTYLTNIKSTDRGVIFLDPYGMSVNFDTLKAIANKEKHDLWYLFPTQALGRQLSHDYEKLKQEQYKVAKLLQVLGLSILEELREKFYHTHPKKQGELFQNGKTDQAERVDIDHIEEIVREMLLEIFPFVAQPLALPLQGSQKFSLFFCVSNKSKNAIKIASRIANHSMLKQKRKQ